MPEESFMIRTTGNVANTTHPFSHRP